MLYLTRVIHLNEHNIAVVFSEYCVRGYFALQENFGDFCGLQLSFRYLIWFI